MIRCGSHWNRKVMTHFQATICVDKHAVNIFNRELFNHTVQLLQIYFMNHEAEFLQWKLITSHKNANLLLKLVRNTTFYNTYTSFLPSVMKLSVFHQAFTQRLFWCLARWKVQCIKPVKNCICWELKRIFIFYNCKEDKVLFSDFFFALTHQEHYT